MSKASERVHVRFWRHFHVFLFPRRRVFLRQTYEGEQLRDHDGPFPEEVRERHEQRADLSNAGGRCPVGGANTGQSG